MKTEFPRIIRQQQIPPVRRNRSRPVALSGIAPAHLGVIFVVRPLSHRSPTIDILGSYFPAWMICIASGLTLTLDQPVDCPNVSSRTVCVSGPARLLMPDDHFHFCDLDHFLSEVNPSRCCHVDQNARRFCYLRMRNRFVNAPEMESLASPRTPSGLRCSLASLRMTFIRWL